MVILDLIIMETILTTQTTPATVLEVEETSTSDNSTVVDSLG